MPVVEFGKIEKDPGDVDFLGGYTLDDLIRLYRIGNPIPEESEEIFKCYISCVTLPYWNLLNLQKLGLLAKGLEVSNYGRIKFNGIEQLPVKGKIKIQEIEFKVYRLVAEVFCENPNCNLYDTVHHIGYDYVDNSRNLLFVTKFQHDTIYEILNS